MIRSSYNFAIAADVGYEATAVKLLETAAFERGLSTYVIMPHNLDETYQRVLCDEIEFDYYYDRASDTSPEFMKLYHLLLQRNVPVLDGWHALKRAADKAIMHQEFQANGITTPYTIIIPPYDEFDKVSFLEADLSRLGRPFVIKPARTTGGGRGVVNGAKSWHEIMEARSVYSDNKYLLQERIIPVEKEGRRFWFRGFYVAGRVECAWWNDITHIYEVLTQRQIALYNLHPLFSIVRKIAQVCRLHFFSTEIALSIDGEFVVIDYVNEVCDLRLQSQHRDGVPDEIVRRIAHQIANHVLKQLSLMKLDWSNRHNFSQDKTI